MKRQKRNFTLFLISLIIFGLAIGKIIRSEYSISKKTIPSLKTSSFNIIERIVNETQVNDYTSSLQQGSAMCALSKDTFAVAWHSFGQDTSFYGVYATVIDSFTGNNITEEFQVNEYTTSSQYYPSICALSSDTFAVTWHSADQDGDLYGIYATVIDATTGNSITAEFRVNKYTTSTQQYSSICALSSDTIAVAWESSGQDGSGAGVYATVIDATTGYNITRELRVNDYTALSQKFPSICALSSSTFAVTWQSYGQDGDGYGVYATVIDAFSGNNITAEFQVNEYTTLSQPRPSICALSSGTFAVTWQSDGQDGSGNGVYATVIDATTGYNITREFRVNEYTTSDQGFPSICALSSDKFAVTWQSDGQDGDGYGVYAMVIDATTGNNITIEFQVNEYTISDQWFPSICAPSSGTFAVAWVSDEQDGSSDGVFLSVFRYDAVAPSVSILSPSARTYGPSSLLINASIVDNVSPFLSVKAMINASNPFNITMNNPSEDYWSCTWDNITNSEYTTGDYKITIWVMDDNGNVDTSQFVIITIDKTSPSVTIISPSIGIYGPPSLLINASIVDELSEVSNVKAMINASTPFSLTMTKDMGDYWSVMWNNISNYPSGSYKITIWAMDDKGNVDQTQSVIIMIDTSVSGEPPILGYEISIVIGIIGVSSIILARKLRKNQK